LAPVSIPWPCFLFFSKAPSYLKEEIKFAREIDGGNGVFKGREKPIAVRKRLDSLNQLVVIEDSREYTTGSQRSDALTMPVAIVESSLVT
jgi:hypothetical protein